MQFPGFRRAVRCRRARMGRGLDQIAYIAEKASILNRPELFLSESQHRVNLRCTPGWKPTAKRRSQSDNCGLDPHAAGLSRFESREHPAQNPHQGERYSEP